MTAETPRVGDTARMTNVHGDVTTIVTGPVESAFGALWVGGYRCHPAPDWTVDIIERAVPPEPPIGSIGVTVGADAIVRRGADGRWYYVVSGNVADHWSKCHERITLLRSGPAPEATS